MLLDAAATGSIRRKHTARILLHGIIMKMIFEDRKGPFELLGIL